MTRWDKKRDLGLHASPTAGLHGRNRRFQLHHPVKVFASAAAGLLLCLLTACGDKGRPSIVLVMVDTLRADRLECYGFDKETAPRIAQLAKEGTRFNRVLAASPWTGPSVVSILTGKYPDEVGVRELRDPLPDAAVTLAEQLKGAGYRTGAVVSNSFIGPAYNHEQGYDDFYYERHTTYTADRVTDQALKWLEGKEEPFFLYVHYTDPHNPYEPPKKWRDKFLAGREPVEEKLFPKTNYIDYIMEYDELKRIEAYYEGEIAFTDYELSRLLEGLPPHTIVVLVGDHGEEFFDHGGFLHGHNLYQELLRVPLIFAGPGIPSGRMVEEPASHVDIAPTVLELAGVTPPGDLSGESLKPLIQGRGGRGRDRFLFSVLETDKFRAYAARQGPWVFHLLPQEEQTFLYHLEQDPREQRNIVGQHPEIVSTLLKAMTAREKRIIPAPPLDSPELEREREEELRALGYIQ